MAEYPDREQFIPLRLHDLVQFLCTDGLCPAPDRDSFRQLCQIIAATFHYEYERRLDDLKDAYAPFDPDADTVTLQSCTAAERQQRLDALLSDFIKLMERANFKHLSRADLDAARRETSAWGLEVNVDFDIFERLELFVRGADVETRRFRRARRWWRQEEIRVPIYHRLVLIVKLRDHERLAEGVDTQHVYLKSFKNIPKHDIEMLLPGARPRMPGLERGKLSASLASTLGLLGYRFATDIGTIASTALVTHNPLALWAPLSLTAGYGYRQYNGYRLARQRYHLRLAESLYYQNLDNNTGVLCRLLDEAEEQECREAILAYYFLWQHAGPAGWPTRQLDDAIEQFLDQRLHIAIDFEIGDAIDKLQRLQLVEHHEDRYRARPIGDALEALDWRWEHCFIHANKQEAQ